MRSTSRLEQIASLVEERGFVSVRELSDLFRVSAVTIRRDLQRLQDAGRLVRTHGGAAARPHSPRRNLVHLSQAPPGIEGALADRADVLIATPVPTAPYRAMLERASKRDIPIIAESTGFEGARTLVAVDNYEASRELGRWAGSYARAHFPKPACLLNLTYSLENTRARGEGFVAGLLETAPDAQVALSVNTHSTRGSAYQLTSDALDVYPDINMIFAINDSTALGARDACLEHEISPDDLILITFGLEGETMRNALTEGGFLKAGLAMFPEIVGSVCIAAAIQAFRREPLPENLVTPHAVLTQETLARFYHRERDRWELDWAAAREHLHIPLPLEQVSERSAGVFPGRIGFPVPFSEHEWYQTLTRCMRTHAAGLGIELEMVDATKDLEEDIALREREIAQVAAAQVQPGDVILINGGSIATYLAEALTEKENLTVITNSLPVLLTLRDRPNITLISTGGQLSAGSQSLTGPAAELGLRELRGDKLFLAATGVSLKFGLSHNDLAEVALKQAMIRVAREVIVLADHTKFGQESVAQVAPLSHITRLITDNALPASTRLELSKLGIDMIIART